MFGIRGGLSEPDASKNADRPDWLVDGCNLMSVNCTEEWWILIKRVTASSSRQDFSQYVPLSANQRESLRVGTTHILER